MYKHILVPMALDHGIGDMTLQIARSLLAEGGQITALHVHEAPNNSVGAYVEQSVIDSAFGTAQQKLDDRVATMDGVTAMTVQGHSGRTIIDTANSNVCSACCRICTNPVCDITDKNYSIVAEHGGSPCLHTLYEESCDSEHSDRHDDQCDQHFNERKPPNPACW